MRMMEAFTTNQGASRWGIFDCWVSACAGTRGFGGHTINPRLLTCQNGQRKMLTEAASVIYIGSQLPPGEVGSMEPGEKKPLSSGFFTYGMSIGSLPIKTIAYVDGFNLYFGSLKGTAYRWLDMIFQ